MATTTYAHERLEGNHEVHRPVSSSAYILVIPNAEGPLFEMLQQLLALASAQSPLVPSNAAHVAPVTVDSWLEHPAAAEYLGIGKSTLYRYAEQEKIEYRKLGNKLQYRRFSLDRFKEQQIRPARRVRPRGIIPPTLGSGN